MVTMNLLRTRLTQRTLVLILTAWFMPFAHAQQPKLTVSIAGVASSVSQNDVISGTVTIKLSGYKNGVTLYVSSAIGKDSVMVTKGNAESLTCRKNGVYTLSLARDLTTYARVDEGEYAIIVDVGTIVGKPVLSTYAQRKFMVKPSNDTFVIIGESITVEDVNLRDSTENRKMATVKYTVRNTKSKPSSLKATVTERMSVFGPEDRQFKPEARPMVIPAKSSITTSSKYNVGFTKPGSYMLRIRLECADSKPIQLEQRIVVGHDESNQVSELKLISASTDATSVDIRKPIRLKVKYALTNIRSGLWPRVTENVVISGPENLSGSVMRYTDDKTDEEEGVYEAKLSKPGSYTWKITLTSNFADSDAPVVATGSFTVIRKSGPASKTVWVSSGGVDSGERSALQISAGFVVYNDAIGPERKIYTNRMSWTEPPLSVNEGDILEFRTSCTQNEHAYLAGTYAMSGFGGEAYQSFISMVTCTNPKDGRDSYNMSLKFIPKDTQKPYIEWSVGESPYTNSYLVRRWTYEKREVKPEAGELPTGTLKDVTPVTPVGPKTKSEKSGDDQKNGTLQSAKEPDTATEASEHNLYNTILPGAVVAMKEGQWIISSFDDPFMAADFGIAIGDEIVRINGKPVHGISDSQMEAMTKTEPGQSIRIEFKHPNGQIVSVVMVR